jgi:2-phospho-L-lactate/phosphoenolpyruvate guanylyltransferase
VEAAVLIPVKAFHTAKARLADVLDPPARAALARWMVTNVIGAVRPSPTFVACDDEAVADWVDGLGASVLWTPGLGLNGAVDAGVATIAATGIEHVIIAHGDLPLPRALPDTAVRETVVLVPDRRRDGTNVLARPCRVDLPASYGGGSFTRHLTEAFSTGCRVLVRVDAELSIDLDTVDDLEHPLVRPAVSAVLHG